MEPKEIKKIEAELLNLKPDEFHDYRRDLMKSLRLRGISYELNTPTIILLDKLMKKDCEGGCNCPDCMAGLSQEEADKLRE